MTKRRVYTVLILTSFAALVLFTPVTTHADAVSAAVNTVGCVADPLTCISDLAKGFFVLLMSLAGYLVWIAGVLLNETLKITVVDMATYFNTPSLQLAWSAFRDLANIILIFVLLAIGIGTILQLEGYRIKTLLPQVIIVAVLINFSLFIGKAIIDVSNVVALQFYGAITTQNPSTSVGGVSDAGISDLIVDKVKLASFYKTDASGNLEDTTAQFDVISVILISLLGIIVFMVISVVLVATSVALAARFVALFFLLTLSSLAFVALILPQTRKYWSQWLNNLLSNAFYAPLYLMLLWVSILVIQGFDLANGQSFSEVGKADSIGSGAIMLNFVLICLFLIGALKIAKEFGAYGADSATKWAGAASFGTLGFLGRNTAGRIFSNIAQREGLKNTAAQKGVAGFTARMVLRGSRGVSSSSFDARNSKVVKEAASGLKLDLGASKGGFKERQEAAIEKHVKFAKDLGKVDVEKERDALKDSVEKRREELAREKELGVSGSQEEQAVEAAKEEAREEKEKITKASSTVEAANREYQFAKDKGLSGDALKPYQEKVATAQAELAEARTLGGEADKKLAAAENLLAERKRALTKRLVGEADKIKEDEKSRKKELDKKEGQRQTDYAGTMAGGFYDKDGKLVKSAYREYWTGISHQYRKEATKKIKKDKQGWEEALKKAAKEEAKKETKEEGA